MRKERKIINTNIRLNLCDEQDRRAWEYLQTMDREKYKSYTRAVVVALNDYFSREYATADHIQTHQFWIIFPFSQLMEDFFRIISGSFTNNCQIFLTNICCPGTDHLLNHQIVYHCSGL